jgi:ribosome-binding protein aMBF1 (putative translation factor)
VRTKLPYAELMAAALKDPDFAAKWGPSGEIEANTAAEFVVQLRREAGLSQTDVQQLGGFSQGYLSTVENGHCNPTVRSLAVIARACGYRLVLRAEREQPQGR